MTENSGLSLTEAMLWKINEVVSASEFVLVLQSLEKISEKEAFTKLNMLIISGLPIYDHSKMLTGEIEVPSYLAIMSIAAKMLDIEPQEFEGEKPPAFSNLRIIRDEAFKVFASLGLSEPYPWPYPPELFRDIQLREIQYEDEIEETVSHGNKERFATVKADILEACLATLAAYPEECRTESGKVVASKLCRCLEKNASRFWPKECVPPREMDTIEGYIGDALKRLNFGSKLLPKRK